MSAPKVWLRLRKYGFLAVLLASAGLLSRAASGQAVASGTRTLAFDVFAGVSELKLDYGQAYKTFSPGFAVGGDVIRRFPHFDLLIEPRFGRTAAKAKDDTQSYFLGDFAISKKFGKFHPYGLAGIGYGKIQYAAGSGQDDSIVYTVGPGVQYDLPFHLAVKADWQYQFWSVGIETKGFNPNGITVSAVYRLHFGR